MAKRQMSAVDSNAAQTPRWGADDARAVLQAWATSGESVAAFARRHGLVAQRLLWWRRRLGVAAASKQAAPTFIPVAVRNSQTPNGTRAPLVVTLAHDDVRVEVHDVDASTAAWVATLARAHGVEDA